MAFIAKSVLAARRAAAADNATSAEPQNMADVADAPPQAGSLNDERAGPRDLEPPLSSPGRSRRRGHATKDDRGKWQPTGNYEKGFARTPEETRFKPGGPPGPGRPKGSVSHDALLTKHLLQKREVSVNGQRQRLTARELIVMTTVKSALEGKDKHARAFILAQDQRLHPSKESSGDALSASALSKSDMLSLAEYEEELRERIREELKAELEAAKGEGL